MKFPTFVSSVAICAKILFFARPVQCMVKMREYYKARKYIRRFAGVKVIDGPAIVHSLSTSTVKTLDQYADEIFVPWTVDALHNCDRIDIVWDLYKMSSLKESTRQKRGKGIRRKVSGQVKLPTNFPDFLRDAKNKEELFSFLSSRASTHIYPVGKEVYITSGMILIVDLQITVMNIMFT